MGEICDFSAKWRDELKQHWKNNHIRRKKTNLKRKHNFIDDFENDESNIINKYMKPNTSDFVCENATKHLLKNSI